MFRIPQLYNIFDPAQRPNKMAPLKTSNSISDLENYFQNFIDNPSYKAVKDLLTAIYVFQLRTGGTVSRENKSETDLNKILNDINSAFTQARIAHDKTQIPTEKQILSSAIHYVSEIIIEKGKQLKSWNDPLVPYWDKSDLSKLTAIYQNKT